MQPSPYTPGEVARTVPGRASQLADIDERLSAMVDLGRLVGRIRVDHAPRGFGKTSLLREYQRRAVARGAITAWVTAGESQGLIAQIGAAIASATASLGDEASTRLLDRIESLKLTIGAPGIAQASATLNGEKVQEPVGVRGFEAVIREAASYGAGIVILIDEVQAADEAGIRTLVYAWQHLQAEGADIPAAVFAAGLPNAPEVIASVVTFSERIAYRRLGPLEQEAEEIALVGPARALGVTWTREAVANALSVAQGYPYTVQLIGDATWAAAGRPDPGRTVGVDDVERGRIAMRDDLEALFRARWAQSAALERRMLSAMAARGDDPVSRADISADLQIPTNHLSSPRGRLIDKGLIQSADRGMLEFTIPGFAEFVRDQEGG
ncbi:ATP-binding protein [Frondihabitans australicus]|uniref:AAA ATPase-like protein n=1 Tax=Frondihabitans australicus TaxID=386892 RepID=A0A495IN09_9MICO|nr:ATP-binding protein [Frondihabitans australicus]RKR76505.1 AAA ATPase-like protein [Frondihabitans australicus]